MYSIPDTFKVKNLTTKAQTPTPIYCKIMGMLGFFHLTVIAILWATYLLKHKGTIKTILLMFCILLVFVFSLYHNGLVNSEFVFDRERFFFINSGFDLQIKRFSQWALYLPYSLRDFVFAAWIIPLIVIGRSISFFWFDKAIVTVGIIGIIPIFLAIKNHFRTSIASLIIIYASVLAGSMSRDPNTSMIYFLVLPQLITLIILGLLPRHETL